MKWKVATSFVWQCLNSVNFCIANINEWMEFFMCIYVCFVKNNISHLRRNIFMTQLSLVNCAYIALFRHCRTKLLPLFDVNTQKEPPPDSHNFYFFRFYTWQSFFNFGPNIWPNFLNILPHILKSPIFKIFENLFSSLVGKLVSFSFL